LYKYFAIVVILKKESNDKNKKGEKIKIKIKKAENDKYPFEAYYKNSKIEMYNF